MRWADAYAGLRFADGGRERPAVDCWGLVRLVYRERCGIDLPSYADISARDLMSVAIRVTAQSAHEPWIKAPEPRAFDVVVLAGRARIGGRLRAALTHVGVMVDDSHVLHVEEAYDAAVMRVDHPLIRGRIGGFFRHQDLADQA